MTSELSVFKAKTIAAAIIAKSDAPANWSEPAVFARLVSKAGCEYFVTASKKALDQFKTAEMGRIFDITVPPGCVKPNKSGAKFGVPGDHELRVGFPLVMAVATEAWPVLVPYDFTPFEQLNQLDPGAFVDIIGNVLSCTTPIETGLRKVQVKLENKTLTATVELLGPHADIAIPKGSVLAIRGGKVSEWRGDRLISTSFVTVVEVNPSEAVNIPRPAAYNPESPLKRAMHLKAGTAITTDHLRKLFRQMREDAAMTSMPPAAQQFTFVGKYEAFTDDLFEKGSPFTGEETSPKLRLTTALVDDNGRIPYATFWTAAVREITKSDIDTIGEMWASCDTEDGKKAFLEMLNANAQSTFTFIGTLKPWNANVQVNVDIAEMK